MRNNTIVLAAAIFFGAVISSGLVSKSLLTIKAMNRFVSVKGLSERNVRADRAVWNIAISAVGNNLPELHTTIDRDMEKTRAFLERYKIAENEISKGNLKVTDKFALNYIPSDRVDLQSRYTVQISIIVNTNKVGEIVIASQNIDELLSSGVTFATQEFGYTGPRYLFTKLNEVKPEMIAEATRNARVAAEEFAKNSQSAIGPIKSASQGVITINAPGFASADESEYVNKTLRVVSSVDYFIKD
jgi:uncharacterized protein